MTEDRMQDAAIELLSKGSVGILTGPPGSGKTYCLRRAIELRPRGAQIGLIAPTGKAARRMTELTGLSASTLHRFLGMRPGQPPVYHENNPLPHDVLYVDEASMLDAPLLYRLMSAVDTTRTAVFFIGDVNQLPSIGPGQVLADMIESEAIPVVRLQTVHRASAASWVCRTAPLILDGLFDYTESEAFRFVPANDAMAYVRSVVNQTQQLVEEHGREEVQVIVPKNIGDYGANALNTALQEELNDSYGGDSFSCSVERGVQHHIRVGDRVVVTSNDYDRAVFNGETGCITQVDGKGPEAVEVDLYDRKVLYSKAAASSALRLAYALSVHKCQGSEYKWCVVALHTDHGRMLNRRLLYTAVTRAREGVVVVGQRAAIDAALAVREDQHRRTTLRQRLQEELC